MTKLAQEETRIKAASKYINYQGINIEASHNAYMDYISGKGSTDTAATAMAEDIRSAISSGELTGPEIVKLQSALTDIVGDTDLAGAYINGEAAGANKNSTYSRYLKMLDEVDTANKSGMSAREFAKNKGVSSTLSDEDAAVLDKYDYRMESEGEEPDIDSGEGKGDNEEGKDVKVPVNVLKTDKVVIEFNCSYQHDETEFARQLNIQETGMNQLTIDEYLKNRERYIAEGRSAEGNALQQRVRETNYNDKVVELMDYGLTFKEASEQAKAWIETQAVLHNPDQIAGGNPLKIGEMGDAGVNSSIGAQWKYRIGAVDDYINNLIKDMSDEQRMITYLNIKLMYSRR